MTLNTTFPSASIVGSHFVGLKMAVFYGNYKNTVYLTEYQNVI